MFSYRHAFHAGNHGDVLKHAVLIALLRHLTLKDTALTVIDTHAGAGLYRLDGDYARTSSEAAAGVLRLLSDKKSAPGPVIKRKSAPDSGADEAPSPLLADYLDTLAGFNPGGGSSIYPGSPFIVQRLLRPQDRLKLFEMHPTDSRTLAANIAQLEAGRQVAVLREDGFSGLRRFLPPPSRRALVLCDPSYELKTDYAAVAEMLAEALKRFATGTYAVWYPLIPRPEAHDLPRRLKTLAQRAGRPWLNASLTVKSSRLPVRVDGAERRPGLPASGLFVVNPPHTLAPALQAALPQLVRWLAQDEHAHSGLEQGGN
ncbi:MAG: 23S rRNA (adenine(2030)-N(6))-methyltransferase RlmJ [Rhodoferax sp.]|nr:23S rRNA (adenine(2030)-N(6))-methyltransferase RlmJ [Rhodoferax sp.]